MTNLTLTKEDQEVQDLSSKNNYTIFELSKERAAELEASYQKRNANSATTCGTITPLPLQREITPPKPFPFEALGSVLGEAATQMHAIIQAPDAICGHSLLAAAALALQPYADIHIDGRIHPLSLFMLTVAESGDRKSAVDTIALKPIRDYEKMLVKTYRDAKKGYKNKKDAWNKFRQEVLSNSQKENLEEELASLEEEPEPPLEPILLMEEPTYEGLVKLFAVGQPSLGLFSDEGGRMFGGYGMSPDNLLKTACGLSSLWDGRPVTRVRGSEGNTILHGRRFSTHLMIQEIVLAKILSNDVLIGQGLLARCLIVYPESNAGKRPYKEADLSQDPLIKRYWDLMNQIIDETFPLADPAIPNELAPRALPLTSEAKARWIDFHDKLDSSISKNGTLYPIRRAANKGAEQALRVAGILTLIDDFHAPAVSLQTMERAITLVRYYLAEALRIHDMSFLDKDLVLAQKVLDWMKKKAQEQEMAKKMMRILEDHRCIYRLDPQLEEWKVTDVC